MAGDSMQQQKKENGKKDKIAREIYIYIYIYIIINVQISKGYKRIKRICIQSI